MKKLLTSFVVVGVFSSIGYGITREDLEKDPILKGKMLAKRCAWCHDINRDLLAPSFNTIIERYKSLPENQFKNMVIKAIKDGSKGKWTKWMSKHIRTKLGKPEDMYMPSQKPYYNEKEMKLIAEWLFSLKEEKNEK